MSEIGGDWGGEPAEGETQEITPDEKQPDPDTPPRGWLPGRDSPDLIRAIQGKPPEGEGSPPEPVPESTAPEPQGEK